MASEPGEALVSSPPAINPIRLGRGTSASIDLELTRRFHEEFLGLQCVRYAHDGLLTRDLGHKTGGRLDGGDYWVLDTRLVETIETPQCVWNHWGVDVDTREEVEQAHRIATERKQYFGIDEVQDIRNQHGSYSFYFSDVMSNWWEIQFLMRSQEEIDRWRQTFGKK
ncbi:VOC family protein [Sphingomonas sp.]|uniref:VOC family protein n=1 Tax=Sphingomonas sp. TaxID=28214 RepID=UPI0025DFF02A|nr:VOC family protein [Sphingomonas sp.]